MFEIDSLQPIVREKLAQVKLLLMDVDGVLTNGRIRFDDNGVEAKEFSTRDGFGLIWVRKYGLRTGVISGRSSPCTELRCRALKFDEIHLGRLNKLPVFESIIDRLDLKPELAAYIGDDLIDLPVMKAAGVSAAPSDAHADVHPEVDIVLDYAGGAGCVRQMIDLWLKATGQWEIAIQEIYHDRS